MRDLLNSLLEPYNLVLTKDNKLTIKDKSKFDKELLSKIGIKISSVPLSLPLSPSYEEVYSIFETIINEHSTKIFTANKDFSPINVVESFYELIDKHL